ncbi:MlaD family protein [bacterium]|nr:MlaD family protein [bacterium]
MAKLSKEFWVGALVLLTAVLMLAFGWLMGAFSAFSGDARYHVLYSFAGGVEVGSPVRVSGVKVGRVESIEFLDTPEDGATLDVTLSVGHRALRALRTDSRFYINMAGIIGERYVEITPGEAEPLMPGSKVRGIDPPRIDQLLSQGYSVFGRIQQFLDEKEHTIGEFIDQLSTLLTDANAFLKGKENRKELYALISNLNSVASTLKQGLKDEQTKQFFQRLSEVLKRAEQVDKETLKKFLQEEGIRARIF